MSNSYTRAKNNIEDSIKYINTCQISQEHILDTGGYYAIIPWWQTISKNYFYRLGTFHSMSKGTRNIYIRT